mgnify:FL=1
MNNTCCAGCGETCESTGRKTLKNLCRYAGAALCLLFALITPVSLGDGGVDPLPVAIAAAALPGAILSCISASHQATAIRAVAESSLTNSEAEKRLDARGIGEVWANVIKPGERRYYEKFRAHEEGDGEDVPGGA